MSMHLVECAANLPLQPSTKLALMAFADSADRYTHIALPGLDQVQVWASVGRSRAAELVAELTDLGLLRKHRAGRRGRRAEYVVFPSGCCREHPRPPAEEESGTPDPVTLTGSATADPNQSTGLGSGTPESMSGKGSGPADPNAHGQKGSGPADPPRGKGPVRVRPAGPLPQLEEQPPIPPASGGTSTTPCPKPGPTPHPNCRGCGTTARQIQDRQRREQAARRREQEQARIRADREAAAAARVPTEDRTPDLEALVAQTRATLRNRQGATA